MSIHIQACVWFVLACDNVSYSNATECKQGSWANDPETISLGKVIVQCYACTMHTCESRHTYTVYTSQCNSYHCACNIIQIST